MYNKTYSDWKMFSLDPLRQIRPSFVQHSRIFDNCILTGIHLTQMNTVHERSSQGRCAFLYKCQNRLTLWQSGVNLMIVLHVCVLLRSCSVLYIKLYEQSSSDVIR
jgi:hypothetical protein